MKKTLMFILVLIIVIGLAACGQPTATPASPTPAATPEAATPETVVEYSWPQFLSMGTGSSGGTSFVAGSVICQLITDSFDTTATAQVTTGAGQSIELVRSGDCELGLADQSACIEALTGYGTFEGNPYKGLRVICCIYNSYWEQMVTNASGIESIDQLAGRRCVVGGPNSGTLSSTTKVYAAYGMDIDKDITPEYVGIAAGIELLQNRQAVAITAITPVPFSSFVELTTTDYAHIIGMSDEAIESMIAADPAFSKGVIPAGTYTNQGEDINTVLVPYLLICDENMDEEMVYQIVKTIYDNCEYLKEQNNSFKEMDLATAVDAITIDLHPGAARFFAENGLI